mmetsp:Transcript_4983/g.10608  ORF Transcript_4983/g.10608 Transcript_4983/m.10608 type:complete len:405 (-) Transcript_4983:397-1611(-)
MGRPVRACARRRAAHLDPRQAARTSPQAGPRPRRGSPALDRGGRHAGRAGGKAALRRRRPPRPARTGVRPPVAPSAAAGGRDRRPARGGAAHPQRGHGRGVAGVLLDDGRPGVPGGLLLLEPPPTLGGLLLQPPPTLGLLLLDTAPALGLPFLDGPDRDRPVPAQVEFLVAPVSLGRYLVPEVGLAPDRPARRAGHARVLVVRAVRQGGRRHGPRGGGRGLPVSLPVAGVVLGRAEAVVGRRRLRGRQLGPVLVEPDHLRRLHDRPVAPPDQGGPVVPPDGRGLDRDAPQCPVECREVGRARAGRRARGPTTRHGHREWDREGPHDDAVPLRPPRRRDGGHGPPRVGPRAVTGEVERRRGAAAPQALLERVLDRRGGRRRRVCPDDAGQECARHLVADGRPYGD